MAGFLLGKNWVTQGTLIEKILIIQIIGREEANCRPVVYRYPISRFEYLKRQIYDNNRNFWISGSKSSAMENSSLIRTYMEKHFGIILLKGYLIHCAIFGRNPWRDGWI